MSYSYRPCKNSCGDKYFHIYFLDHTQRGDVAEAVCLGCGVIAVAVVDFTNQPLADAWNMANMPMGQDEGIERAMP